MAEPISYKTIKTRAGDTFDGLAYKYCANEQLASELILLNQDYCDVLIFGEGISLTIPVYDTDVTPETLPPWRTAEDDS